MHAMSGSLLSLLARIGDPRPKLRLLLTKHLHWCEKGLIEGWLNENALIAFHIHIIIIAFRYQLPLLTTASARGWTQCRSSAA